MAEVMIEADLVGLLIVAGDAWRLFPEQTEGPYRRDVHPIRREISEGREGLPLRLGLRLLDRDHETPLTGVLVEVWQADKDGRYSGFQPIDAGPGEEVTSASVSRDIVAPDETFLRGAQHTDMNGMCAFTTIYPGWYPSRAVHIHVIVHLPDGRDATTQLYFPDELTDEVFSRAPYAGRAPRDTTNATDSIFADGGEATVLKLSRAAGGLTGVLVLAVADDQN